VSVFILTLGSIARIARSRLIHLLWSGAHVGPAGNKVAVRFTNSGTQTGPFMGAPRTGKHAGWLGIGIYTVTCGKISEAWFGEDVLGMLVQLGIVNMPG
jgi:hypothetical protein